MIYFSTNTSNADNKRIKIYIPKFEIKDQIFPTVVNRSHWTAIKAAV